MTQDKILADFQAFAATLPAGESRQLLQGRIVQFFLSRLDEYVHVRGGIEEVIRDAEAAFDRFVVPYDIPGVPNLVEPLLEQAARQYIGTVLRDVHARIHKEPA